MLPMWLHIFEANAAREQYETAKGVEYHTVVRMRAYLVFSFTTHAGVSAKTWDLSEMNLKPQTVHEPPCGRYLGGLCDQLFMGTSATMALLTRLYFHLPALYNAIPTRGVYFHPETLARCATQLLGLRTATITTPTDPVALDPKRGCTEKRNERCCFGNSGFQIEKKGHRRSRQRRRRRRGI